MKTLIIAGLVCGAVLVGTVGCLVHIAEDVQEAPKTEQVQDNPMGITTQGRVGVRMTENLCIDPATGQTQFCF